MPFIQDCRFCLKPVRSVDTDCSFGILMGYVHRSCVDKWIFTKDRPPMPPDVAPPEFYEYKRIDPNKPVKQIPKEEYASFLDAIIAGRIK